MGKNKGLQFNLPKRSVLKNCLDNGQNITQIANALGLDKSSVSRELARNRTQTQTKTTFKSMCNTCQKNDVCSLKKLCPENCNSLCKTCSLVENCPQYKKIECKLAVRFPYICDRCEFKKACKDNQYTYDPALANKKAEILRSESRSGINLTLDEYTSLNSKIENGVKNGQSIYHIKRSDESIIQVTKTLYNYVKSGYFSTKPIDLPRCVKLKKRKKLPKKYEYCENKAIDRTGHMYSDFLLYKAKNGVFEYLEMDFLGNVIGSPQKVLCFVNSLFQFVILKIMPSDCTQADVAKCFDEYERILGEDFAKMFKVILTDRDPVFNDFKAIEFNKESGVERLKIFYCDPSVSNQKPNVENENGQLRIAFPKNQTIENLSQEKANLIASNFNSRHLASLGGLTPNSLFIEKYGEPILTKLGLKVISEKEVKIINYTKY